MTDFYRWHNNTLKLSVAILPKSRVEGIRGIRAGHLGIAVNAPPAQGKANESLRRFLARETRTPLSRVAITAGMKGRHKRVEIDSPVQLPSWLHLQRDQ